jgi:hypothetical protein
MFFFLLRNFANKIRLYRSLLYILSFLNEVAAHCSENFMTLENLARVWSPNLIRAEEETAENILSDSENVNRNFKEIFTFYNHHIK